MEELAASSPPNTASLEYDQQGQISDVVLTRGGRVLRMLGDSPEREIAVAEAFLNTLPDNTLPVLLGAGAGFALERLAEHCKQHKLPLCVIDREADILAATAVQKRFNDPSIYWLTNSERVPLQELTLWQEKHGNQPLAACALPFYTRLHKAYYGKVREACDASTRFNFWDKVRYTRFAGEDARILLLTSKYFLMGEITSACERMGVPHKLLQLPDKEFGHNAFIEMLLEAVVSFKPDFVFTINHLGVDREGILVNLLEKLRLPMASWFVDNPHLILAMYKKLVSPWTALFTWDADNLQSLRDLGFDHVSYLPLGTDAVRFTPLGKHPGVRSVPLQEWYADVSFVGNSMVHKVASRKEKTDTPGILKATLEETAAGFSRSDERSVLKYLEEHHPHLAQALASIPSPEDRLGYEAMLTWEATRQYRFSCIAATFPFTPLIVGDDGWTSLIPPTVRWRQLPEVNYYSDLPIFYPCSAINFNCTSKQMKGAVNQRVFDVPATASFLLTDYREQVENLFEPGKEIVCYTSPDEAEELIRYYLASPEKRKNVADAARKRILQEHTYEHRVQTLIRMMRAYYA